jgi:mannose-6-phosphate isomerase-like protein (cupin superfamily)
MLELHKRYANPETGTWLEVVERDGPIMKAERSFAPGSGRADPHLHEDLTQTWEVLSGEGRIEVDGIEREFRTGDRVELTPGTKHRDPWNPGSGGAELHLRGTFEPNNDFIEAYTEAYAHLLVEGRLNEQEELPLLQILVIAKATDGRSYGASPPVAIQKAALPLMAAFGRLRGYKASYL